MRRTAVSVSAMPRAFTRFIFSLKMSHARRVTRRRPPELTSGKTTAPGSSVRARRVERLAPMLHTPTKPP